MALVVNKLSAISSMTTPSEKNLKNHPYQMGYRAAENLERKKT
jgi:hypothetical protein